MPTLRTFRIRRFKKIADTSIDLSAVNVIVGANNSGKSSIIQGLHFAIGVLQSITLAEKWTWKSPSNASLSPEELIYSPSLNPYALAEGGRLVEARDRSILFDFTLGDGQEFQLEVGKGRNNNIAAKTSNPALARTVASLDNPYSIFSPGLAGIAKSENYVSDGVLLRALARGDANIVLRNIILRLWDMPRARNAFLQHLHVIFPDAEIQIDFNAAIDENIDVNVLRGNANVPLELAGTGLLQAIQILSYIHRFRPSVVVLDEPDSHLHPNNQRLVSALLHTISEELDIQVILTTHSRHVVDALGSIAKLIWTQDGKAAPASAEDEVGILMDLGALDLRERVRHQPHDLIVLTEDEITTKLEHLLWSNGFSEERTLILPYYGVTEPHHLRTVIHHLRQLSQARVLVHRDRDYLNDDEVEIWKTRVRELGCEPFVTDGTDIESYFVCQDHLASLNPAVDVETFSAIIAEAAEAILDKTIEGSINGRLDVERKNGNRQVNVGRLSRELTAAAQADPIRVAKGKELLRAVRLEYQRRTAANLVDSRQTEHLRTETLRVLAERIIPRRRHRVRLNA